MRAGAMIVAVVLLAAVASVASVAAAGQDAAAPAPAPTSTRGTTTAPKPDLGPDVVMLRELVDLYQPVPFSHRRHAEMAEMWGGCVTCHHRPPSPNGVHARPAADVGEPSQDRSDEIPACKTCHPIAPEQVSLRVPSLKGAYHRQCLNCHREWAGGNQCGSCHAAMDGVASAKTAPTPDDIVGRMHPPIPEPEVKLFRIRVAPVAGPNVLFRHEEHVREFGIACSACHRRDTCADCHASLGNGASAYPDGQKVGPRPLQIGRTWKESHTPCTSCHADDACADCHYRDDQPAPAAFVHRQTGQVLDERHAGLACSQCHSQFKSRAWPTCGGGGDASCHIDLGVWYPLDRPGPVLTTAIAAPTTAPSAADRPPPATRPTVIRIRRGGS